MAKKPLYERYSQEQAIASYPVSAFFGILIFNPLEEDELDCDIVSAYWYDGILEGFRRHIISYTIGGRPYICKGNRRFYLDNFMRID